MQYNSNEFKGITEEEEFAYQDKKKASRDYTVSEEKRKIRKHLSKQTEV